MTDEEEAAMERDIEIGKDYMSRVLRVWERHLEKRNIEVEPLGDDVQWEGLLAYQVGVGVEGAWNAAAVILTYGERPSILGPKTVAVWKAAAILWGEGDSSVGLPDHLYCEMDDAEHDHIDPLPAIARAAGIALERGLIFDREVGW